MTKKMSPTRVIMVLRDLKVFWRSLVVLLTPILLLPLITTESPSQAYKCGYVVMLMAVFWVTEVLPIGVTALLPIPLLPLLGIMSAKDTASNYIKDSNMVFVGGLIMAISLENSGLHKRMALKILMVIGTSTPRLLLGFMVSTWLLSMCISNPAATAMMMPVADAALQRLQYVMTKRLKPVITIVSESDEEETVHLSKADGDSGQCTEACYIEESQPDNNKEMTDIRAQMKDIYMLFGLGVCYAANVGGNGTLMGNTPNLAFKGIMDELYSMHGDISPINYTSWIPYALPTTVIALICAWAWLQIYCLGFRGLVEMRRRDDIASQRETRLVIVKEYKALGGMSFGEIWNLVFFVLLILLWLARNPGFMPGYESLFKPGYVSDVVPAILVCVILFVFPMNKPNWAFWRSVDEDAESGPALVNWHLVSIKLPWHLLLTIGGGFTLADAVHRSGLSDVIGEQMMHFSKYPDWIVALLITIVVSVITEFCTNTATATLSLSILRSLCQQMNLSPVYIMFPATLASNFAFMLPAATGPNAIAYSYGFVPVIDMMRAGVIMKIISIAIVTMAGNTWGLYCFDMAYLPWQQSNNFNNITANNWTDQSTISQTMGSG